MHNNVNMLENNNKKYSILLYPERLPDIFEEKVNIVFDVPKCLNVVKINNLHFFYKIFECLIKKGFLNKFSEGEINEIIEIICTYQSVTKRFLPLYVYNTSSISNFCAFDLSIMFKFNYNMEFPILKSLDIKNSNSILLIIDTFNLVFDYFNLVFRNFSKSIINNYFQEIRNSDYISELECIRNKYVPNSFNCEEEIIRFIVKNVIDIAKESIDEYFY